MSSLMLSKSNIQQLMRKFNFHPKRRLGQNFLIDKNILRKIIEVTELKQGDVILEIGPGLGALTEELVKRVKNVIAVELDKKLCQILKESLKCHGNVEIIQGDIRKFSFSAYRQDRFTVIGNLPYYITTPVIVYLLQQRDYISSILITVQKEVAKRLVANPGKKDYGAITCFVRYYANPSILFYIKRTSFWPQPEVDSAFIKLEPSKKPAADVLDEELFFKIIRAAFQKRRKIILNALRDIISKERLLEIFKNMGIDPKRRGETLSLEEFARIANQCIG